jgi:tetratricopeptide (TPR) repeat protein
MKNGQAEFRSNIFRMQALYSSGCGGATAIPYVLFSSRNWTTMDRIEILNEILAANPDDAFARYGLAMEYAKTDVDRAMQEFEKLLAKHPEYTAGYFMAAQTLANASRVDEAKSMLNKGIATAKRSGNSHAESEMEAMLSELG